MEVLRSWHIEIMQFVCIGGKVGENVLKCCGLQELRKSHAGFSRIAKIGAFVSNF